VLLPVYVALLVALVFYAILPIIGGYLARNQWRRFRQRLVELHPAPLLELGAWATRPVTEEAWLEGDRRFFGSLEAIEGDERIWMRGAALTATIDLGRAPLYLLASETRNEYEPERPELVRRLSWSKVRVFPEGAKLFVGGAVRIEGGKAVFREKPGQSLIVVSYAGSEENLLERLVSGGRRDNEYWNALSRVSLALGIGILTIFLSLVWKADYFPTVIFLSVLVTLFPVLALMPPGLPFFFLYLHFWKRGLAARTRRDLLRLPSTGMGEGRGGASDHSGREAEATRHDRAAMVSTLLSALCLALSVTINFILAFLLWRVF